MSHATYSAEALADHEGLSDIRIHINGKTWHLWGRNGAIREQDLAGKVPDNTLPVLMGAGLGHCLAALLDRGMPVAVVDREIPITELTGLKEHYAENPSVVWIAHNTPEECLAALTAWQKENDNKPLHPVPLPLYLRLDRPHYGALAETLNNAQTDFWSQARYPKFQSETPRILFFDSNYFLCGEILAAFHRLGIDHRTIALDNSERGSQDFIETLLRTVIDFKPDFILTVNHFGLDREGKLAGLLLDLKLPLASWFVDNPHLILHQYAHPGTDNTAIFTYDAGNLDQMREKGFANTFYLPLATDPNRFKPGLDPIGKEWASDVSFVGNSMVSPVAKSLKEANLPHTFQNNFKQIAAWFGESGDTNVTDFFKRHAPEWDAAHRALPTTENQLALESLITWEATRQYRLDCVLKILPFAPLIVGDAGWHELIPSEGGWRYATGLDYYDELPRFYPASKLNFNCTSRQMPGAVNQRVFDVPAAGAFLLTDYRDQMESLFDLDKEVAVYRSPDEIPDLVGKYLREPLLRKQVAESARTRILAEHTYELRIKSLLTTMRSVF